MNKRTAEYWINKLQLASHIEGGAFREIYRSPILAPLPALPTGFPSDRSFCTSIYFLLQQHQFSAFHKIKSDEVWHFYYGDALIVYEIDQQGQLIEHRLGCDPENNESFQCVIAAGNWFAARLAPGSEYALVGCTVSPGFDFEDFELANQQELIATYPAHKALIQALTIN
ncbi:MULTISPECIES: cupin domain-containing protein [Niastella]|uniref:Cupin domain-containing protein n=1 Tax=Niastella soli TaxID=2821487 RepID=A0ABS3Z049_9BACT|nr:cupin domain-containing protein [Niastella soli]MBO9203543.1 cupin domain-containing protein [Niastella soli]